MCDNGRYRSLRGIKTDFFKSPITYVAGNREGMIKNALKCEKRP